MYTTQQIWILGSLVHLNNFKSFANKYLYFKHFVSLPTACFKHGIISNLDRTRLKMSEGMVCKLINH